MLMSVLSMSAAFEVNGLYYEPTSGKTVKLVQHPDGMNHYSGNIQIPDKVKCNDRYYIVDEIDDSAFSYCTALTSVSIPNSVTQIGSSAFSYCTALTSVSIPNSVTQIGWDAFSYCTALTSVSIPNSVTQIESSTFYGCTALSAISIPNSVTQISSSAFYYCTALTSVSIPNSVTQIDWYAFCGCTSLTAISIPNSVTQIGVDAFYSCTSLSAINVDSKNQDYCSEDGILYNKAKTELVKYPEGKTVSSFTVPNTVTKLELSNLPRLTTLNIPNSVTDLYLNNMPELNSLNIPNSVTYLRLSDIPGLTALNIPNSVTSLSLSSLPGPTALNIPNSVTSLTLSSLPGPTALNIPNSVTNLGLWYVNGITSLNVPNTVENLTLNSCTSLETVDLQEGALEKVSFINCSALTSVNIPDCVTELYGDNYSSVFSGCTSLTRVKLPKGLTEIPSNTFYGCKSLTKISRLPATVTKIGENAFYGCRSLEEIEIPAGVTEIPKGTFCGCRSLKTIEMPGVTKIGDMAFACCPNLTLNIPNSITDLGKCSIGASAITFDCTTIPSYALDFEDRKFDAITIGKNVYDIEDKALRFRRLISLSVLSDFECGDENFNSFDFDCRVDRIYCPMNTPPDCFGLQFTDETYSYGQLFVPQGTESKYSKVDPWRNFINVTEMDASVGNIADENIIINGHNGSIVITGAADNAMVEVYDMAGTAAYRGTGKTVSGLPGGVYIVRVSGKTAKVRI